VLGTLLAFPGTTIRTGEVKLLNRHPIRSTHIPSSRRISVVLSIGFALAVVGGGYFGLSIGPVVSVAAQEGHSGEVKTLYTCGMHPEVISDKPGLCPKCGMKLTPMDKDRAAMILEARGEKVPENAGKPKDRKILYWRAPMDPTYIRNEPGKSPMGMDLVPVYADDVAGGPTIRVDPVTEQNMGVRYDVVREGPLEKTIRTVGTVDYDEQSLGTVTTKVDGWVEKLDVEETGTQVHQGDPLFEFYSRDLFTAQQEYLIALRDLQRTRGNELARARVDSARQRLELYDISDAQIAALEKSGKPRKTLTITAQMTGIITHRNVTLGQYLKAGEPAYQVADLSNVWVMGKVYESDLPYVKLGQEARMRLDYLPGRTYRGRVTYIYPYLEKGTREIAVRMEFHNPGYVLKPGMYATLELSRRVSEHAVLVPAMAVIDTGERKIAFVQRAPGKFEPRRVETGLRGSGDELQVLSGLAPGEKVVVSGQFLLDSESRLREATLKMINPGMVNTSDFMNPATPEESGAAMAGTLAAVTGGEHWVCPMPSHAGILYDHPGKCPLCGMKLVPTNAAPNTVDPIDHYTCPMPEHYSVHEKGPGKCPLCGMTLIPVTRSEMKRFAAVDASKKPVQLYVCPMPAHADVVSTHPGTCPRCGMKLVPVAAVPHGAAATEHWHAVHDTSATAAAPVAAATSGLQLYTCPMESHAHVVSNQPGKCPLCEMKLVPVSQVAFAAKSEAAWQAEHPASATPESASGPITLYTCPMHAEDGVVSSQPGRCPLCNMALVPAAKVKNGDEAVAAWRMEHPQSATAEIRPATPQQ